MNWEGFGESVMLLYEGPSLRLPGDIEEMHEKPHSGQPAWRPTFEPAATQERSRSANNCSWTLGKMRFRFRKTCEQTDFGA